MGESLPFVGGGFGWYYLQRLWSDDCPRCWSQLPFGPFALTALSSLWNNRCQLLCIGITPLPLVKKMLPEGAIFNNPARQCGESRAYRPWRARGTRSQKSSVFEKIRLLKFNAIFYQKHSTLGFPRHCCDPTLSQSQRLWRTSPHKTVRKVWFD